MSKKMNPCVFLTLTHFLTLGFCDVVPFSICWTSQNYALERKNLKIWLNRTKVTTIKSDDNVISLTVPQFADHRIKLHYGNVSYSWLITTSSDTELTKVKGQHKPTVHPTAATQSVLDLIQTSRSAFACEAGTVFLHQEEDFFLAFGSSKQLPVTLTSHNASTVLLSWVNSQLPASHHSVSLYQIGHISYSRLRSESTAIDHHQFTGLDSCSPYVACVRMSDSISFICISFVTEPNVPLDFQVRLLNSSTMHLSWLSPEDGRFSMFLLTAYYVDFEDYIYKVVPSWQTTNNHMFNFDNLDPCSRVMFGLQTICQAGPLTRFSKIMPNSGNIDHFNIESLRQTFFGAENYTIDWETQNASFSGFLVYHEGALHGVTNTTSYSVMDLLPCHSYETKVQALCGDVLMREKTVTVHTVPRGVSEIKFNFSDSIASWTPGTPDEPTLSFVYELSLENGPILQRSRQEEPWLHLPSLVEGRTYVLDVWEECHADWESERLHLCITKNESAEGSVSTADSPSLYQEPVVEMDYSGVSLIMSVPWSLPVEFLDTKSEPGAKLMRIIRSNMQSIMDHYDPPVHVEVASIELSDEPDKTRIVFMSFDAANTESGFPQPTARQLEYLKARHSANITVSDGLIHWTGPDLCSTRRRCPRNSLCLNTLGSFACLCRQGYYDVSPVLQLRKSRSPVCHENGLFSQCLERMMIGGIAKPYLTSYIGGEVDVKLNDGRCDVEESDVFFVFHTSRMASKCGTERRVNKTHIEFQNTLTVTLTKTEVISRRDLKVVWQCVYPLHYVQNAHFNMDMQWLSPLSLVEFNSSVQLLLTMTLYSDLSFSEMYHDLIQLEQEDTLFFQVALHTNNSFASDALLQVDSCWATESSDPDDPDMGVFIQDGCAVDNTVHWLNVNGLSQTSRFSVQMFYMPKMMPLYFHCLANICGHDEQCTKNCSSLQRRRRAVEHDPKRKVSALVSAGPLTVGAAKSGLKSSPWTEHTTMISIVIGLIGVLTLTVLSVIATKLILKYWERVG